MKKIHFITLFLFLFLAFGQTQAAGLVPCGGPGESPCDLCHLLNIIKFVMFKLVPVVAALMLIVGGIMFFGGGAKPNILNQAKGVITSVFIGLLIVFCAWIIINTVLVQSGIVKAESVLKWYEISCEVK